MNTAKIKLELFRKIDALEDNKVQKLHQLLFPSQQKKVDFWDSLNKVQIKDIEDGIKDLDLGRKKDFYWVIELLK